MSVCTHCGAPVNADQNFCLECGRPVSVKSIASAFDETVTDIEPEGTFSSAHLSSAPDSFRKRMRATTAEIDSSSAPHVFPVRKRTSPLLLMIVALACVTLIGLAVFFVLRNRGQVLSANANTTTTVIASASSTRASYKDIYYRPGNMLDRDMTTAWVEGVEGRGTGEWVRFDFGREVNLRSMFIAPGYFKDAQIWLKNNRVAAATLYFSDGHSRAFRFPDRMEGQTLQLGSVKTSWVRLSIDEVYAGMRDAEDTAISEISFEFD